MIFKEIAFHYKFVLVVLHLIISFDPGDFFISVKEEILAADNDSLLFILDFQVSFAHCITKILSEEPYFITCNPGRVRGDARIPGKDCLLGSFGKYCPCGIA